MLVVRGYDDNTFRITSFLQFSYPLQLEQTNATYIRQRVSFGTTEYGKCPAPTNPNYLCLIS
jgi:hypothetical protein